MKLADMISNDIGILLNPNILINGSIDEKMLARFFEQLASVKESNQNLILELNTLGGDADAARRIALEVRLFSAHSGKHAFCVGKSYVYSAGVTIFAAFESSKRFLTEDAVLLVHERRQTKSLEVSGAMTACIQIVREELATLELGLRLEKEGFEEFVKGSRLSFAELSERAKGNCYMTAEEALDHGLIAKVLR
jgi:ATP-dependent Clp protease protease subunit